MTIRGRTAAHGGCVPRYELRLRGRVESAAAPVPGFDVVEQRVTTVLCGNVQNSADLQGVLAHVQGLGLEVMECHQIPTKPTKPTGPHRVGTAHDRPVTSAQTEARQLESADHPGPDLVVLQLPADRFPSALNRVLTSLAKDDLVEIIAVIRVERRADGLLLGRPATSGLPKRLVWQLRRWSDWMPPMSALQAAIEPLDLEDVGMTVAVVALESRSPVDRLASAAELAGGTMVTCVSLPDEAIPSAQAPKV